MKSKILFAITAIILICFLLFGCGSSKTEVEELEAENTKPEYIATRVIEYSQTGDVVCDTNYYINEDGESEVNNKTEYIYDAENRLVKVYYYCDGDSTEGKLIEEYRYNSDGLITCSNKRYTNTEYEYDKDGNLISKETFNSEDELEEYEYNTYVNGIISTSEYYWQNEIDSYEDENGESHSIMGDCYSETEYDSRGRVVKDTYYEANELPYYYTYTYGNNEIIEKCYNHKDEEISTTTILRDELGRKTEYKTVHYDGEISIWIKFEYTDDKIIRYSLNEDGSIKQTDISTYDKNGYLIKEESDKEDGSKCTWEYSIDDYGYITKIITSTPYKNGVDIAPEREYYDNGVIKKEIYKYSDIEDDCYIYHASKASTNSEGEKFSFTPW